MNTVVSERRIRNNRIRRKRQLRRHLMMSFSAILLTMAVSFIFFGFKTKAQDNTEEILYKYYKSITVEEGDTLWAYALAYGAGQYDSCKDYIEEVVSMNALKDTDIMTGQRVIIPYYSSEFICE